jgi:hypothetical protein
VSDGARYLRIVFWTKVATVTRREWNATEKTEPRPTKPRAGHKPGKEESMEVTMEQLYTMLVLGFFYTIMASNEDNCWYRVAYSVIFAALAIGILTW